MAVPEPLVTVLRWQTRLDDKVWARLKERGIDVHGGSVDAEHDGEEEGEVEGHQHLALGPTLPDAKDSRVAQIEVTRMPNNAVLNWGLTLYAPPESPPPAEVLVADEKCGGQVGLRGLVQEAAGSEPLSVTLTASLALAGDVWQCSLLSTRSPDLDELVRPLGGRALREQVGYRFEDGISGLREVSIVYDHPEKRFHILLRAQLAWEIGPGRWLSEDLSLARLVVGRLFTSLEAP